MTSWGSLPQHGSPMGSPGVRSGDVEAVQNALRRLGLASTLKGEKIMSFLNAPRSPATSPQKKNRSLGIREVEVMDRALQRLGLGNKPEGQSIRSWLKTHVAEESAGSNTKPNPPKLEAVIAHYSGKNFCRVRGPRRQLMLRLIQVGRAASPDRTPLVLVQGEAGCGKTAVAAEFARVMLQDTAKRMQSKWTRRANETVTVCLFCQGASDSTRVLKDVMSTIIFQCGLALDPSDVATPPGTPAPASAHPTPSAAGSPLAHASSSHASSSTLSLQTLQQSLLSVLRAVLDSGRPLLLVLDGLDAAAQLCVGCAVLEAHRAEVLLKGPRTSIQCLLTSVNPPRALARHIGLLAVSVTVPPLSPAERHGVWRVWEREAKARMPEDAEAWDAQSKASKKAVKAMLQQDAARHPLFIVLLALLVLRVPDSRKLSSVRDGVGGAWRLLLEVVGEKSGDGVLKALFRRVDVGAAQGSISYVDATRVGPATPRTEKGEGGYVSERVAQIEADKEADASFQEEAGVSEEGLDEAVRLLWPVLWVWETEDRGGGTSASREGSGGRAKVVEWDHVQLTRGGKEEWVQGRGVQGGAKEGAGRGGGRQGMGKRMSSGGLQELGDGTDDRQLVLKRVSEELGRSKGGGLALELARVVIVEERSEAGYSLGEERVGRVGGYRELLLRLVRAPAGERMRARGTEREVKQHAGRALSSLPWVRREAVRAQARLKLRRALLKVAALGAFASVGAKNGGGAGGGRGSSVKGQGGGEKAGEGGTGQGGSLDGEWKRIAVEALLTAAKEAGGRVDVTCALLLVAMAEDEVWGLGGSAGGMFVADGLWPRFVSQLQLPDADGTGEENRGERGVSGLGEREVARLLGDVGGVGEGGGEWCDVWSRVVEALPPATRARVQRGMDRGAAEREEEAASELVGAALCGDEPLARSMLRSGWDPARESWVWGTSAVHAACASGHANLLRLILNEERASEEPGGAAVDVNGIDLGGRVPATIVADMLERRVRSAAWRSRRAALATASAKALEQSGSVLSDPKVVDAEALLEILLASRADVTMWGRGRGGLCAGEQVRRLMGEYCGLDGLVFGGVGEVLAWRGRWAAVCIPGDCLGQDEMGRTPLHWAAARGDAIGCKELLDAGCDWRVRDWKGWTAVHVASERGSEGAVDVLLAWDATQARAKDGLGRTPLHVWGYKRCSKAAPGFKSLVLASESAKENADGQTQLHACAGNGGSREQFAYLALSLNGADTADREGGWRKRTAPVVAADAGNEEVVEECVAKSMLGLDALDGSGRQLIDVVCERRLRISSTAMMQAWGSVAGRRWWPCPVSMAFVEAVAANTWWGINTLLQGESLLYQAVLAQDRDIVTRALALKADPNLGDPLMGALPLSAASRTGSLPILSLLTADARTHLDSLCSPPRLLSADRRKLSSSPSRRPAAPLPTPQAAETALVSCLRLHHLDLASHLVRAGASIAIGTAPAVRQLAGGLLAAGTGRHSGVVGGPEVQTVGAGFSALHALFHLAPQVSTSPGSWPLVKAEAWAQLASLLVRSTSGKQPLSPLRPDPTGQHLLGLACRKGYDSVARALLKPRPSQVQLSDSPSHDRDMASEDRAASSVGEDGRPLVRCAMHAARRGASDLLRELLIAGFEAGPMSMTPSVRAARSLLGAPDRSAAAHRGKEKEKRKDAEQEDEEKGSMVLAALRGAGWGSAKVILETVLRWFKEGGPGQGIESVTAGDARRVLVEGWAREGLWWVNGIAVYNLSRDVESMMESIGGELALSGQDGEEVLGADTSAESRVLLRAILQYADQHLASAKDDAHASGNTKINGVGQNKPAPDQAKSETKGDQAPQVQQNEAQKPPGKPAKSAFDSDDDDDDPAPPPPIQAKAVDKAKVSQDDNKPKKKRRRKVWEKRSDAKRRAMAEADSSAAALRSLIVAAGKRAGAGVDRRRRIQVLRRLTLIWGAIRSNAALRSGLMDGRDEDGETCVEMGRWLCGMDALPQTDSAARRMEVGRLGIVAACLAAVDCLLLDPPAELRQNPTRRTSVSYSSDVLSRLGEPSAVGEADVNGYWKWVWDGEWVSDWYGFGGGKSGHQTAGSGCMLWFAAASGSEELVREGLACGLSPNAIAPLDPCCLLPQARLALSSPQRLPSRRPSPRRPSLAPQVPFQRRWWRGVGPHAGSDVSNAPRYRDHNGVLLGAGVSCLSLAIRNQHWGVVQSLVAAKADVRLGWVEGSAGAVKGSALDLLVAWSVLRTPQAGYESLRSTRIKDIASVLAVQLRSAAAAGQQASHEMVAARSSAFASFGIMGPVGRDPMASGRDDSLKILLACIRAGHSEAACNLVLGNDDLIWTLKKRGLADNAPLLVAAAFGDADVVRTLLGVGADTSATNSQGQSVLEVAMRSASWAVVFELVRHAAALDLTNGDANSNLLGQATQESAQTEESLFRRCCAEAWALGQGGACTVIGALLGVDATHALPDDDINNNKNNNNKHSSSAPKVIESRNKMVQRIIGGVAGGGQARGEMVRGWQNEDDKFLVAALALLDDPADPFWKSSKPAATPASSITGVASGDDRKAKTNKRITKPFMRPRKPFATLAARVGIEERLERLSGVQLLVSLCRRCGVLVPLEGLLLLGAASARAHAAFADTHKLLHPLEAPRARRSAFPGKRDLQQLVDLVCTPDALALIHSPSNPNSTMSQLALVRGALAATEVLLTALAPNDALSSSGANAGLRGGGALAQSWIDAVRFGRPVLAGRVACVEGDPAVCSALLRRDGMAAALSCALSGDMAVHLAQRRGLAFGPTTHARTRTGVGGKRVGGEGVSGLHLAIQAGQVAVAETLVKGGVDVGVGWATAHGTVLGAGLHSLVEAAGSVGSDRMGRGWGWGGQVCDSSDAQHGETGTSVWDRWEELGQKMAMEGVLRLEVLLSVKVDLVGGLVQAGMERVARALLDRKDAGALVTFAKVVVAAAGTGSFGVIETVYARGIRGELNPEQLVELEAVLERGRFLGGGSKASSVVRALCSQPRGCGAGEQGWRLLAHKAAALGLEASMQACLRILKELGAEVGPDSKGRTLVMNACLSGRPATVREALRTEGPRANVVGAVEHRGERTSALLFALRACSEEVVLELLRAVEATPDAMATWEDEQNVAQANGMGPLHWAAGRGMWRAVRKLVEKVGVDASNKDQRGCLAQDYVRQCKVTARSGARVLGAAKTDEQGGLGDAEPVNRYVAYLLRCGEEGWDGDRVLSNVEQMHRYVALGLAVDAKWSLVQGAMSPSKPGAAAALGRGSLEVDPMVPLTDPSESGSGSYSDTSAFGPSQPLSSANTSRAVVTWEGAWQLCHDALRVKTLLLSEISASQAARPPPGGRAQSDKKMEKENQARDVRYGASVMAGAVDMEAKEVDLRRAAWFAAYTGNEGACEGLVVAAALAGWEGGKESMERHLGRVTSACLWAAVCGGRDKMGSKLVAWLERQGELRLLAKEYMPWAVDVQSGGEQESWLGEADELWRVTRREWVQGCWPNSPDDAATAERVSAVEVLLGKGVAMGCEGVVREVLERARETVEELLLDKGAAWLVVSGLAFGRSYALLHLALAGLPKAVEQCLDQACAHWRSVWRARGLAKGAGDKEAVLCLYGDEVRRCLRAVSHAFELWAPLDGEGGDEARLKDGPGVGRDAVGWGDGGIGRKDGGEVLIFDAEFREEWEQEDLRRMPSVVSWWEGSHRNVVTNAPKRGLEGVTEYRGKFQWLADGAVLAARRDGKWRDSRWREGSQSGGRGGGGMGGGGAGGGQGAEDDASVDSRFAPSVAGAKKEALGPGEYEDEAAWRRKLAQGCIGVGFGHGVRFRPHISITLPVPAAKKAAPSQPDNVKSAPAADASRASDSDARAAAQRGASAGVGMFGGEESGPSSDRTDPDNDADRARVSKSSKAAAPASQWDDSESGSEASPVLRPKPAAASTRVEASKWDSESEPSPTLGPTTAPWTPSPTKGSAAKQGGLFDALDEDSEESVEQPKTPVAAQPQRAGNDVARPKAVATFSDSDASGSVDRSGETGPAVSDLESDADSERARLATPDSEDPGTPGSESRGELAARDSAPAARADLAPESGRAPAADLDWELDAQGSEDDAEEDGELEAEEEATSEDEEESEDEKGSELERESEDGSEDEAQAGQVSEPASSVSSEAGSPAQPAAPTKTASASSVSEKAKAKGESMWSDEDESDLSLDLP